MILRNSILLRLYPAQLKPQNHLARLGNISSNRVTIHCPFWQGQLVMIEPLGQCQLAKTKSTVFSPWKKATSIKLLCHIAHRGKTHKKHFIQHKILCHVFSQQNASSSFICPIEIKMMFLFLLLCLRHFIKFHGLQLPCMFKLIVQTWGCAVVHAGRGSFALHPACLLFLVVLICVSGSRHFPVW